MVMTKRILDEKQEIENYSSAYNIIPSSMPAICDYVTNYVQNNLLFV